MGTGSEDYFTDAWGLHVTNGLYAGVTVADGTGLGSRMTGYRWHFWDPIPFTKSLVFDIEHLGWTYNQDGAIKSAYGVRNDLMSSVSFWYQDGIATGLPPVPYGSARLPQGNALQFEVETVMDAIAAEKGKPALVRDLFWSKDVVVFQAEGPGAKLTIPFDVAEAGDYELYTQVAQGSDYGIYTVLLDGKPPVAPVLEHEPGADVRPQLSFDGYAYETYVGMDYQIGWPRLTKGKHTVTFVCVGKNAASTGYALGVDNLILARTGPEGWKLAATTRAPNVPTGVAALSASLSDPDAVVRGLCALELAKLGPGAAPALPALIARLKDSDPSVRMASADGDRRDRPRCVGGGARPHRRLQGTRPGARGRARIGDGARRDRAGGLRRTTRSEGNRGETDTPCGRCDRFDTRVGRFARHPEDPGRAGQLRRGIRVPGTALSSAVMKTVALAVLAGFLATVAPGSGAAPLECCGTKCPACAPVFCKETPAVSAVKAPPVATLAAASVAFAAAVPGFDAAELVRVARSVVAAPGFVRPMRN